MKRKKIIKIISKALYDYESIYKNDEQFGYTKALKEVLHLLTLKK